MLLAEFSWSVNGIKSEIFCINEGKTETGYIIPEKIETRVWIRKFIGSACLKYKTNDSAKNDIPKKGIIITKKNKNESRIDASENEWSPNSWSRAT